MSMKPEEWQIIAAAHRTARDGKIPYEWLLPTSVTERCVASNDMCVFDIPYQCGMLSAKDIFITDSEDATSILEKIAAKQWSAVSVTTAFCKRAAIAQQLVGCLTEICFEQARNRAMFLDQYLEKEGKVLGPLHGLPISVKDSYQITDTHATIGYISFIKRRVSDFNSCVVDILLGLGAIVYCKTNIPQTMMTCDTHNNLFGRTLNPYNLRWTAGGSSGGEAALIALRGSILGMASDVAGSIRIPALCCGLFGFKPSSGRIPFVGKVGPGKVGSPGPTPAAGPIGRSVRDLSMIFKLIIESEPWSRDALSLAVPWRDVPQKEKLVIGLLLEDPIAPITPPVMCALEDAEKRLVAGGHSVRLIISFPSLEESDKLVWEYLNTDDTNTPLRHLRDSGEPMIPSITAMQGAERPARVTMKRLFAMNAERAQLKMRWHKIFEEEKLDVLMMPSAPHTAPLHDTWTSTHYTALWNLIDYPTIVIPFLRANKRLDHRRADGTDTVLPYDPELCDGAPTSLQFVGRPLRDEELLSVAHTISEVLEGSDTI